MMINISIAITTHRVSILGENSVPSFGSYISMFASLFFLYIIYITLTKGKNVERNSW